MSEQTVQVPVSLPTREQIAAAIERAGDEWSETYLPERSFIQYAADAVLALLSQPTPTAEPDAASKLEAVRELARKARWGCERWADPLPVPQYVLDLEAILDPSTIRDVTPPKDAA